MPIPLLLSGVESQAGLFLWVPAAQVPVPWQALPITVILSPVNSDRYSDVSASASRCRQVGDSQVGVARQNAESLLKTRGFATFPVGELPEDIMLDALRRLSGFLRRRELNRRMRSPSRTRLRLEGLETRRLLAGDMPLITGTVFADANNDNLVDPGEGVQGAIVRLFQDDGDGIFEPGTDDVQVGTDATTDANGVYCFANLDQDVSFFVQQPAQSADGHALSEAVSAVIQFTPGLVIDAFETTQSTAAFPPPVSNDESALGFPDETEVIGAERDLAVQLTAGGSEVQLRVNPFGLEDVLLFDSSAGSQGSREITWDGVDADGDTLAFGLGGRDLTMGGTLSGITMRMGVDANGANARFRLYQDNAGNVSELSVPIPVTGGTASQWVFLPFSDFSGPVSATNVDAIQLILETGSSSVDGQIDVIGVIGEQVANFPNPVGIDLELSKVADVATADNGDTVTWTITVTNNQDNATSSATGVVVQDLIPAGLTLINSTPSDGTFITDTWTLASPIAPGASETLILETTVDNSVAGGTTITNVAQITAHNEMDLDSTPNNDDGDQSEDDEDADSITVNDLIDLELTKVADATTVDVGDQVTFTLTITNNAANANTAATNVEITDLLPADMTLISSTPSGNGTFNNGVWALVDPLAEGGMQTLVLVAEVNAGTPGNSQLTNSAQVTQADQTDVDSLPNNDDGDQSEDDEAAASFGVNPVIDLELQKTANVATADLGDAVVWTVTLTNNDQNANTSATNVVVEDVVPAGLSLQSATPSGNSTFNNGIWTLVDPLAPNATATLTLNTTVTGGAGGSTITNVAQVQSADQTDFDSTPNNDDGNQSEDDEAAASVMLASQIDLELTKSVSTANAVNGDQVTWTITVTNNQSNANANATGVEVTDVLPADVTFVSATPSSGTFANDTWAVGTIAPGSSATLGLVTTVNADVAGGTVITNAAQVSAANEVDIDSTPDNDDGDQSEDDEDAAQLTVSDLIDIEVQKTTGQSNVSVGDTVTWTVEITNNADQANTAATGVVLQDILPAGVTFVSATTANGSYDEATGIWTVANPIAAGGAASLSIVVTVDESAAGSSILNVAEILSHDQPDADSTPDNDDGDQSEDDEDGDQINVGVIRPISKRALLASAFRT